MAGRRRQVQLYVFKDASAISSHSKLDEIELRTNRFNTCLRIPSSFCVFLLLAFVSLGPFLSFGFIHFFLRSFLAVLITLSPIETLLFFI